MKDIPKKVRDEVLERDSFDGCPCCMWCGNPWANHLHHVKRRSQGGTHTADNLVLLCYKCHAELHSGNKEIQEFCEDYLRRNYVERN